MPIAPNQNMEILQNKEIKMNDPHSAYQVLRDAKTGLYYREEAKELQCLRDKHSWYYRALSFLKKNKPSTLLNIGGHIGIWNKVASEAGMKVVSYEPLKSCVELASLNAPLAECRWGAVGQSKGTFIYYASKTSALCRGESTKGATPIKVLVYSFDEVVAEVKPQAITLDCEGGEYDILLNCVVPEYVTMLDIEIHLQKRHWKEELRTKLLNHLTNNWNCLYIDKDRNHWAQGSLHSFWERK